MAKDSLKTKLSDIQYHVTQECGTEPPFQNAFWNNKKPGIYVDIVSGEPLFSSTHKYDSGTGWPSFYRPLQEDNIISKDDYTYLIHRIEVKSREGNSHLGHLFNDGPDPTGLRYCINSAALRFIPADRLTEEGYGEYADLFTAPSPSGEASGKAASLTGYATLGGGCFWCLEAVFERIDGVMGVVSGYAGGSTLNPTYTQVCSGKTGHAEVVRIQYDPARLSYPELLELFWKAHDPTTLNRQGADTGTQYRSIILYESEEQKLAAEQSILKQQSKTGRQIVTELVPLAKFYPAEKYHQDYFAQNRQDSYCRIVIEPKLEKLKLAF